MNLILTEYAKEVFTENKLRDLSIYAKFGGG